MKLNEYIEITNEDNMELSATELRIGNLVGIASSLNFNIGKVTLISNNRILLENKISNKNHKFIPIELTEEWLLRFGFEKAKHSHGYDCYIKDGFDFDIVSHGRYWVLAIYTDESCTDSLYFAHGRFEYVHQLQNLYFALTGEELTI